MNPLKSQEDPHQWIRELYKRLLSLKKLLPQTALPFPDPAIHSTIAEAKMVNEEIRILLERIQQQPIYPRFSVDETELMRKINKGFSSDFWNRYQELQKKRYDETLTDKEQVELIQCSDSIESANVKRIQYLVELAQLKNMPLSTIVEQLEIAPSAYA